MDYDKLLSKVSYICTSIAQEFLFPQWFINTPYEIKFCQIMSKILLNCWYYLHLSYWEMNHLSCLLSFCSCLFVKCLIVYQISLFLNCFTDFYPVELQDYLYIWYICILLLWQIFLQIWHLVFNIVMIHGCSLSKYTVFISHIFIHVLKLFSNCH